MTQTVIKEKLESHRVDLIIKLLSAFKKNKSSYNLINNTDKVTQSIFLLLKWGQRSSGPNYALLFRLKNENMQWRFSFIFFYFLLLTSVSVSNLLWPRHYNIKIGRKEIKKQFWRISVLFADEIECSVKPCRCTLYSTQYIVQYTVGWWSRYWLLWWDVRLSWYLHNVIYRSGISPLTLRVILHWDDDQHWEDSTQCQILLSVPDSALSARLCSQSQNLLSVPDSSLSARLCSQSQNLLSVQHSSLLLEQISLTHYWVIDVTFGLQIVNRMCMY